MTAYRLLVRCATPEVRCRLCREKCVEGAILRPLGYAGEAVRPPASICAACVACLAACRDAVGIVATTPEP